MIYTKNPEDIKREIKIMLLNANMTQIQLSEKLGKSPQSVNNVIRQQNISLYTLTDIANAAGYDVEINFVKRD
ncbi:helix-turn-helix domain-containing protein [Enterocloster bolteae]|jgi:transcriptional regulator with XRE-family HTH domain|uniref:helix-turn-helix domain-containing protein n=1 Tax=Enterocloster bolteae TaxID=208479 RepID=UPI0034B7666C